MPGNVPYSQGVTDKFCSLLTEWDKSEMSLIEAYPGVFPTYRTLWVWRRQHPRFDRLWTWAKRQQSQYLLERVMDKVAEATPATAHLVRVQMDHAMKRAAKLCADIWGDRPSEINTNIAVGIKITQADLDSIAATKHKAQAQLQHHYHHTNLQQKVKDLRPQSLIDFDKARQKALKDTKYPSKAQEAP